ELAVFPCAQQQRSEGLLLVRRPPAADDELLALAALDLEPAAGALAAIGIAGALGDHPLIAAVAHGLEEFLAPAGNMLRELDGVGCLALADELCQALLALAERQAEQILAILF